MNNRRLPTMLFSICFIASFFTTCLYSDEITIDIPADKDNTLYEDADGGLSNGAGSHFFTGRTGQAQNSIRRGLLSFAIRDSIPAEATIQSVTLTLHMSKTPVVTDRTVELHRVLVDWGEGGSDATGEEGSGGAATAGDATWIHTFHDTAFWSAAGGDFSPVVTAAQDVGAVDSYTWGSTAEMVADVQDWLDEPGNNFGWLVLGDESEIATAKRFDTRENPTAGNRPVLTVTYMEPTGVDVDDRDIPIVWSLAQNYPNPFNPTTTITYSLESDARVTLKIYNVLGREIRTLVNGTQAAGFRSVVWDGKDDGGQPVSSGIYVYRMVAGASAETHKMVLLK